jgi:hypothetical protein
VVSSRDRIQQERKGRKVNGLQGNAILVVVVGGKLYSCGADKVVYYVGSDSQCFDIKE